MSSAGSPAWASSQSSTPRRPSGPTSRLPQRKSPCTVTVGPASASASGRWVASQRTPSSRAGRTSPRESSSGQGVAQRVGRRQALDVAGSMVWMAARARPHCAVSAARAAAHSGSRRIFARDRLALEALDHEPGAAERVGVVGVGVPVGRGDHGGNRDAGAPGRVEQALFEARLGPARRAAAAVHLQDERAGGAVAGLEVERAGDPRGPAREPAQPVHRPAEARAERGGQLFGAQPGRHG